MRVSIQGQDGVGAIARINSDGTFPVTLIGSKLVEQQTEADVDAGVLTFTDDFSCIEIFNTSAVDGTFTVNGISIIVPAGKSLKTLLGGTPGKTVTIAGATTYVVCSYV